MGKKLSANTKASREMKASISKGIKLATNPKKKKNASTG